MIFRHNAQKDIWMRRRSIIPTFLILVPLIFFGSSCSREPDRLILATTTSTYDSGLLDEIIPDFESQYEAKVDIIAVGTGQAISLGERGDADVVLVHDREKEEAFVAAGHGSERVPVMYNDFIIVGPLEDPASVLGMESAVQAFRTIADARSTFVSRGDQSGTFAREQLIWEIAGIGVGPSLDWYLSIGQGMGETLQFAQESNAYTLTDRGTYLSLSETLQEMIIMVGGTSIENNPDPGLINEYSVIPVIPVGTADPPSGLALAFVKWLTSADTKVTIAAYTKFDQPLFRPTQP
jgi:tungstate transport system substrate-binding protein